MGAMLPLLLALGGLAAVAIAAWLVKDPRPASPGLGLRMALVGIVILLGALGLYWAGTDETIALWVVLGMALLVNLLGVSMWWHLRRLSRGPRQP